MTNEQRWFLQCLLGFNQSIMTNPRLKEILSEVAMDGQLKLFDYLVSSLLDVLGADIDEFQCDENLRTFSLFLDDPATRNRIKKHEQNLDSVFRDVKIKQLSKYDIFDSVKKLLGNDVMLPPGENDEDD
jgi:hypothetical protein